MNKICTSIEQSKKLIELGIDVNTADMYYPNRVGIDNYALPIEYKNGLPLLSQEIPAWSLVALLGVIPSGKALIHDKGNLGYKCICNNMDTYFHDNPVDVCVAMIEKLLKML